METGELVKLYLARQQSLKNERNSYEALWRNVRDYIAPRTARFDGEQLNRGEREDLKIINATPRFALRTLASGMQSGLTSPMRPWFKLDTPDPDLKKYKPVKEWLEKTSADMRTVFSRSNLYDRLKSNYSILGGYGTSCLFLEDDDEDMIRAHDFLIGTFYLASDPAGRIDTLHRETSFSTKQMVQKFGKRISTNVQAAYDNGDYNTMWPVCHIVEPNQNYRPGSALPQHKLYASIWIDKGRSGGDAILAYRGYDYKPFMAPRWNLVGENTYGEGCGEIAIGDAKQLQVLEKRKLQGVEQNVEPTMLADMSMRNQRTSILPRETVYTNGLITGNPGFRRAFEVNTQLNELREEIAVVSQRIDEAFYKNLFLMVAEIADQPNITATQINAMREEKLLALGPVLERLNDDVLDPIIDRTFSLMAERGMIAEPPQELQGLPLKIEYTNIFAQAQKAMGLGNVERFVGFVGQVSAYLPDALDKIDVDAVVDEYADAAAIPPKLVRDEKEVAEVRAQRAQQQQAMQDAQTGMAMADTAKTLSETDVANESALTRALEVAGAGS